MQLLIALSLCSLIATASASGRGICDGKVQTIEDLQMLSSLSWWYSWALNPLVTEDFPQKEFVAMAWGTKQAAELATWKPHPTTKTLLGFNEPNLHHQSNLTPEAACKLWPTVTAAAQKYGLKLGSPAANHCKGTTDNCYMAPTDWFDAFFALPGCDTSTVDFVATHKYGCNASDTIEYVKQLHARYGKPIWLTEFSCAGAPKAKQLAFMKEILPVFDSMPDVIPRYAWFHAKGTSQAGTNDVLIEDGKLNSLGQFYNTTSDSFMV